MLWLIYEISLFSRHVMPHVSSPIARFMGPTWGPPGSCRPHMGRMLALWTLLSGMLSIYFKKSPEIYVWIWPDAFVFEYEYCIYIPKDSWLHVDIKLVLSQGAIFFVFFFYKPDSVIVLCEGNWCHISFVCRGLPWPAYRALAPVSGACVTHSCIVSGIRFNHTFTKEAGISINFIHV